jgi:phosphopentomutase
MGNCYVIVIDGLGVGAQEDAADYGDENENTLGHLCEETGCKLPNLQRMGLGNIIPLASVPIESDPLCAYGKMRERSPGKDSTTGHWEIAGIQLNRPFPTYPDGFPAEVIEQFCEGVGVENALVNKPYSGTEVIADYGEEHLDTGYPIVYTSADSVFQVATHVDVISIDKLCKWCKFARKEVFQGKHGVGRVIARPFCGEPGNFERLSDQRYDYSMEPPEYNLINWLYQEGIKTYSIGKIKDLFAEQVFTQFRRTKNNAEGISQLLSLMSATSESFVFVNLLDTDQKYGHRLDPKGFAESLQELDRAIPAVVSKLQDDDILIITGDHGNDPTSESTDHSREFVPVLLYPSDKAADINLGTRKTFSDIASTAADFFNLPVEYAGESMLNTR